MMAQEFTRQHRVAELLRRELAVLIDREVKDPRVSGITVNDVEVSRDLSHAKVYVSALSEEGVDEALKGLRRAAGFLRGRLGRALKIRAIPELHFRYDDTQLKAERLDALIEQARREDMAHGSGEEDD